MQEYDPKTDPITAWELAIIERFKKWTIILVMFAFVCGLFAPLFAPWFLKIRRRVHVMSEDYEAKAWGDMKIIFPMLCLWSLLCWIFVIFSHTKYY